MSEGTEKKVEKREKYGKQPQNRNKNGNDKKEKDKQRRNIRNWKKKTENPSYGHSVQRKDIIKTCLDMNKMGINQGTSGNVSVRIENNRFLITPSGVPYSIMKKKSIVTVTLDDEPGYFGAYLPSSEWRLHYDIYRNFPEAKAVVHAHPTSSTALSALPQKGIPAFHYMVGVAGGKTIRTAKYATFGTQELSDNMVKALKGGRRACLLSNHGSIAFADSLTKALYIINEVECLSKQYIQALSTGQEPTILPDEEMDVILDKFKTYGKQPSQLAQMPPETVKNAVSAPKKLGDEDVLKPKKRKKESAVAAEGEAPKKKSKKNPAVENTETTE